MRTSVMVLACLLLLQLLATTAHGIRLDRQLHEAITSKKDLDGDSKDSPPSDAVDHSSSRRCTSDGNCSGKGKKPVAPQSAPGEAKHQVEVEVQVQTTPKKSQHEAEVRTTSHAGRNEAAARTWPRQAKQKARTTTTYPDILDIAGMDYSPAARKPPIHN